MNDSLSKWEARHGEVPYDKAIMGRLLANPEPLDCQTCEGEIFHRVGCPTSVLELREMEKYDAYWETQRRRFPSGFFEPRTAEVMP